MCVKCPHCNEDKKENLDPITFYTRYIKQTIEKGYHFWCLSCYNDFTVIDNDDNIYPFDYGKYIT